ncbi:MAG: Crp/Fnr family transcriptional regulator [Bacteroidales bacterium]|nr:Crp/Fnr family transcriptional regulator [Bacteroidales bacterium]
MNKILNKFTPISEHLKTVLSQNVTKKEFPKGHVLLQKDSVCKSLYLVEQGFLRGFYFQDGSDKTLWFASENDIATSMYSFISQKPSLEIIEVVEKSILYSIDYEQLQHLYETYPELNLIGRLLTEKYYIEMEERVSSLQFQTAEERYRNIIENKPSLLQKASLGQIASYLGITQETLSRIRKKI